MIFAGIKGFIIIILGVIYLPINMFVNWLGPMVHDYWYKKDYIMFFLVGIVFGPLWGISALFSVFYEKMVESMH